jgi:hypothetical protein
VLQVVDRPATTFPTAVNDGYSTQLNTPLVIPAPGVLANDNSNGGGATTATLVATSPDGTVTLNANGGFTFTPAASFVGTTTFTYQGVNSVGPGNIATVTIAVHSLSPPTTVDDAFTVPTDFPFLVSAPGVLANDNANGGGAMSVELIGNASHGGVTLNGDGSFVYSPNPGFSGADSFIYRATNANGPGNAATVNLTVSGTATVQPPSRFRVSSIVGNVVTFRWDPPSGLVPTNYVLEGGINPGEVLASLPTGSAYPIFTLRAPSGAFYARIHAISGAGRGEASNEIRLFVNVPAPPSAPADLVALVDGSSLALAWRNTFEGGSPTSTILDVTGSITGSVPLGLRDTAAFAGVPPGTYTVRVRAVNAAGTSEGSNPLTVTVPDACSGAPLPPANFLAYKLGSAVHVVWDPAPAGPASTSYVLNVGGTFNLTIPTPTRSLSGVVPPGTYNLSVAATNACGTSAATFVQVITVP